MSDKIIVKTVNQCPFYDQDNFLESTEFGDHYVKTGWCSHPKLRSIPNCENNYRKPPPKNCPFRKRGKLEIDVQREGEI